MNNRLLKLDLTLFRNYTSLSIAPNPEKNIMVITGKNGTGKTNILEAISLLAPGKGIRGALLSEMHNKNHVENHYWQIGAEFEGFLGLTALKSITESNEQNKSRRSMMVNGTKLKSQAELSKLISVSWITPQMDLLFIGPAQNRRKYWDRIVQNFEPNHAHSLQLYEHAMTERLKLLKNNSSDNDWLSILEQNMASSAIVIAMNRVTALEAINFAMDRLPNSFPKATIGFLGEIERAIKTKEAKQLESSFQELLKRNRKLDAITGRTNAGIHRVDLEVLYQEKKMPAAMCSTGEQKSLLLSIFLADVFAQRQCRGRGPIILLDEVLAHLDVSRREILCQIIYETGVQCWMTGTEREIFAMVEDRAEFFDTKFQK